MKVTENVCYQQQISDEQNPPPPPPVRIALPSKDQKSANAVRNQLGDLSRTIDAVVQPVYTSQKMKGQFKLEERMSASRVDTYINEFIL